MLCLVNLSLQKLNYTIIPLILVVAGIVAFPFQVCPITVRNNTDRSRR